MLMRYIAFSDSFPYGNVVMTDPASSKPSVVADKVAMRQRYPLHPSPQGNMLDLTQSPDSEDMSVCAMVIGGPGDTVKQGGETSI